MSRQMEARMPLLLWLFPALRKRSDITERLGRLPRFFIPRCQPKTVVHSGAIEA